MTHVTGEGFAQPVEQIRDLQPHEALFITADTPPIYSAEESYDRLGIHAPLKALVQASSEKSFMIFDLSGRTGPVLPDEPRRTFNANYIVADEGFQPGSQTGYKGIRNHEPAVQIGRRHYTDFFDYTEGVSRDHFSLESDKDGLTIQNHTPANGTTVIWSAVEHAPADELETLQSPGYGLAELALKGDDQSLVIGRAALYGVFDGVGGDNDGGGAARYAANFLKSHYGRAEWEQRDDVSLSAMELRHKLQDASDAIIKNGINGSTTGTVFQIVKDGDADRKVAVWASAGDSRLYHARDEQLSQVTYDEGHANYLYNSLGRGSQGITQSGRIALLGGDRLILATDGITGDSGSDLLSDQEITAALKNRDGSAAAKELLRISRKRDDKTVIVVDI